MTKKITKKASVFTRINPKLKQEADSVLNELQIPMSTAINIFLQQVVDQRKIPFEIKLPDKPINYASLSEKKFNQIIKKGFDDFEKGNTFTEKQIRQEFKDKKE